MDGAAGLEAIVRTTPSLLRATAAAHLWYGEDVEPLGSSAEAVATWPETATAVALRLDAADRLEIVAPFGLEDLFAKVRETIIPEATPESGVAVHASYAQLNRHA